MTIAIGFLTGDGAVICADSQEMIGSYGKSTAQKIRTTDFFNNWRLVIAGASDQAHYIDLFQDEVVRQLIGTQTFDYGRVVSIIKATLHKIHKQHIWLRRSGQPQLQLLIGIQGIDPPSRGLLWTEEAVVLPVQEYRSIGIGTYAADAIWDRLFPTRGLIYNSRVEIAANFGIYMLRQIKKAVQGCDGFTLVAILKDGKLRWVPPDEVVLVERASEVYDNSFSVLSALLDPTVDTSEVESRGAGFSRRLGMIKSQLQREAVFRKHMEETMQMQQKAAAQSAQEAASAPKRSASRKTKGRQ